MAPGQPLVNSNGEPFFTDHSKKNSELIMPRLKVVEEDDEGLSISSSITNRLLQEARGRHCSPLSSQGHLSGHTGCYAQ
ncbi:hypothetical protein V8E54_009256, partial [Elaphomyces granulatus]